jgi:hypothetical protein
MTSLPMKITIIGGRSHQSSPLSPSLSGLSLFSYVFKSRNNENKLTSLCVNIHAKNYMGYIKKQRELTSPDYHTSGKNYN